MTQQPPPGGPQPPYGPQQPPPGGPQPPYGPQQPPPGGPQPPYGQQFTPQYGAGGYPPPPKKGNGCVIAGVIVGAVAVLAVAALIVVFALRGGEQGNDGGQPLAADGTQESEEGSQEPEETDEEPTAPVPQGDFTTLPECTVAEHDELDRLVPGYRLEVEDVDTEGAEWWEGYHCSWDNANSSGDGSYYFLTIVVNDPLRYDTYQDLDLYADDYPTEEVTGLGDGALSWYDTENEVGCVSTYLENLSLSSCYDEMSGGRALPESKAIDEAENLARATLDEIAQGDYR